MMNRMTELLSDRKWRELLDAIYCLTRQVARLEDLQGRISPADSLP